MAQSRPVPGTPTAAIQHSEFSTQHSAFSIRIMASHASALKAYRQNIVRRERNRQMRSRLRTALRNIRSAIDAGDPGRVKDALRETISLVDKMASKRIIHRNAAARYKGRLAKRTKGPKDLSVA